MGTTEFQTSTLTELDRIAWLSSQRPEMVFTSLMHHFNVGSLGLCYQQLDGKKAVGTDGIDKREYGQALQSNLQSLINRMKSMSYRPQPVRQVWISKEGKAGASRPLGISNFEDKLVQKRMQQLLESVYDPIFTNRSYGFRPGRGCHDAIKDLFDYLHSNEVDTVIDVDLSNFFGTIDHDLLTKMLKQKISDTRFLRYIRRMFKAGVLAEGELTISDEGIPQGSCCSPVLANIFAHNVIDEWFETVAKKNVRGRVEMFRYADDIVICCQCSQDAQRLKTALGKRLTKYKLSLNEEKTQLVSFSKRRAGKGERQETFDFLGFTFYIGRSRKGGTIIKLKTSGKRFRSKLKKVNEWCRAMRNRLPLRELWKRFCAKLRGHAHYYGVSHNSRNVGLFIWQASVLMFKWLNRRSQRKSFDWGRYHQFMERFPLPRAKVCHRLF